MKNHIFFYKGLAIFLICLFRFTSLEAQASARNFSADTANYPYWIRMMQDPEANYFATVSAFEKYWKNRRITKGCGWKVFKRWQYIMSGRITPDGKKPSPRCDI